MMVFSGAAWVALAASCQLCRSESHVLGLVFGTLALLTCIHVPLQALTSTSPTSAPGDALTLVSCSFTLMLDNAGLLHTEAHKRVARSVSY